MYKDDRPGDPNPATMPDDGLPKIKSVESHGCGCVETEYENGQLHVRQCLGHSFTTAGQCLIDAGHRLTELLEARLDGYPFFTDQVPTDPAHRDKRDPETDLPLMQQLDGPPGPPVECKCEGSPADRAGVWTRNPRGWLCLKCAGHIPYAAVAGKVEQ